MAQAFAGISPEQIGYVEAHGTATQLGDPIELTALTKTFSAKTGKKQYCGIGSVKSNIGHTDTAAGVASFIKAVLSAYNRIIPPSLNYSAPNPHFNIKNSPFFVQDRLSVWEKDEPLIIGVSSFGIGGTNSHVIIKEHPKPDKNVKSEGLWPELVMLSAKSKQSLEWRKDDLIEFAGKHPDTHLGDISFTLRTGRSNMPYRSFCVVNDLSGIKRDAFASTVKAGEQVSGTAFMFPGQGAQYPGMGRTLYRSDQQFRSILDNFFEIYRTETGSDLMSLMFSDCTPENERLLARTDLTQPAIFIIEYALARLYMDAGIRPRYLIGHSIGEYTAACISGVFDPDQALLTVIKRGRLMQSMPAGCMLAVKCGREHLVSLGSSLFEIAADNSDRQCTISLEFKDLDSVKSLLNTNGIESIRLSTSHAFHSAAFDQVMKEFEDYINSFSLKTPEIPFISCLTGDFITSAQAVSGKYWAQQLRHMVNFRRGVSSIINTENVILLEVGPGTHLTGLARQNKNVAGNTAVIPSLGKDDASGEMHKVIVSIGNLWAHGINAEPEILNRGGIPSKVTLPVYRFQRVRHWIDHFPEPARRDVAANEPKTIHETVRVSSQPENGGITDKLREIVSKVTGFSIDSIREDASFDEMGIDSLSLASFSQNIYRKFHVRIAFRQLATDLNTINLLAKALTLGGAVAAKPARPQGLPGIIKKNALNNFVRFQPNGKKNPLIIVHGERADRFIPEYLGNDQPYFGYIHPGSDGEKIIFKSVEETASLYLDQLLETRPQGPLYIGGYSFGGLVAFEMAVRLCRMGIDVPWVVLFDTTASRDDLQWADDYFKSASVNYLYRNALNVYQLMKSLVCESCIGLNKRVPVKLREFYIIRNYNRLSRKYCPSKFGGRIILFRVRENKSPDQYLGWKEHAGDVTVIPLEGKHDSMFVNSESIKVINSELRKLTGN
jgi:acyl transferase domain-containing protein